MKKIINLIKNNYKEIIFFLAFFVINLYFIFVKYRELNNNNFYLLLMIVVCILEIFIFFFLKKNKISKEKKFLFLSITIGILYIIAIPPGSAPDEGAHFKRAYEISEGYLLSDKNDNGFGGRILPNSVKSAVNAATYDDVYNLMTQAEAQSGTSFQEFSNTSLYSPVSYIPQVIGILIGRILNLPMIIIAYLAKICNFIVCMALVYFAYKKLPIFKNTFALIALMPMSMQALTSLQADGFTNAIAFALVAFVINKMFSKEKLTKKENFLISLLAICMSMCKIVYLPICLILFLIPKECFKNKKDKYMKTIGLAIIVIILNLIWLCISSGYLVEYSWGVNPTVQLSYIFAHPIKYFYIIFKTIFSYGNSWYYNVIGSLLEWRNVSISDVFILFYGLFILYTALCENNNEKYIKPKEKILIAFIVITCILLMFTSLYIQWTGTLSTSIDGVQGRYFIPLMLPIILLFSNDKIKGDDNNYFAIMLIMFINIYAIMMIVAHHM